MDTILVAAFGVLLWLPAADNLLHLDHASAFNEKRAPAAFPTFIAGPSGVQIYVKGWKNTSTTTSDGASNSFAGTGLWK